jgi:hypothetical protein
MLGLLGKLSVSARLPEGLAGRSWKGFHPIMALAVMALGCGVASANDIYIAQSAAGTGNGQDCGNALATAYFNARNNWGSGAGQIAPGATVHICGTLATPLGFNGSGTSGNVITLLFEPGAKLSASGPVWNAAAPISLNGNSFILINGGTTNVSGAATNLEAIGNGSGMATQLAVNGINLNNAHDIEIKNFGCSNLYVHTSLTDTILGSDASACIYANPHGANISIHDSTFHDNEDGILLPVTNSGTLNLTVYNMNMYNMDHFLFTSCHSSGSKGFYYHDNHIHDPANWDTTTNSYHHDGWLLNSNTGQTCDQIYDYNNLYNGDWGNNNTSPIFLDNNGGVMQNTYVFNDVFMNTNASHPWGNGINIIPGGSGNGPVHVWNNTVICGAIGGAGMQASGLNVDFRNNVQSTCGSFFSTSNGTGSTISSIDYNYYANLVPSGGQAFSFLSQGSGGGTLAAQFAAWQSVVRGAVASSEAHSSHGASAGLNSSGAPQAGSAIIGAGVNLCNMLSCTGSLTALASDTSAGNTRTVSARSASGAWDIGAYVYVGGNQVNTPTNLTAVSH